MQTNSYDPTLDEAKNKKHDSSVVALNPKVGGTCPKDGGLIVDGQCQECGMKHKQESYVSERTLTRGEEKEKEKNVKGMKKSFSDFKKRYGDDAKSVMYATATKMAKEETEIAEGKKKGLWDNIHAKRKRGEKPAKPGDKDYPETLNVESAELDERTRYAKETGKDPQTGKESKKGGTLGGDDRHSKVMRHVQKDLRKSGGMMSSRKKPIQPQGKKKEKGAKGYQGQTPVDRIKAQLAKKRAPKPDIGSRFD